MPGSEVMNRGGEPITTHLLSQNNVSLYSKYLFPYTQINVVITHHQETNLFNRQ